MSRKMSTGIPSATRPSFSGSSVKARATPSMRPSISSRASTSAVKGNPRSSYIGTSDHHLAKDPRPLSDKSYMKKSVMEVVHLLNDLAYPKSVYPKMLNPPTNKDYQQIFEFLMKVVLTRSSYKLIGRPDEEMLRTIKTLGYPFNVSKSNLNNVGTMSSWPQALGVLSWLSQIARYTMRFTDSADLNIDDDMRKQVKFEFFYKCYEEFMKGIDGPYPHLNQHVEQKLDELDVQATYEIKELQSINSGLSEAHLNKLKEKESKDHLTDELANMKSNTVKMRDYNVQVEQYIAKVKEKSQEARRVLLASQKQVEEIKELIPKLKTEISLQPITPAAAERLLLENEQLERSVQRDTELLDSVKKTMWDKEMQYSKMLDKLDDIAKRHNDEMQQLAKVASRVWDKTRKAEDQTEFRLETGYQGVEVNNTRLIEKILPKLTSRNKELLEIQGSVNSEINNVTKRLLQDKEALDDLGKKNDTLLKQLEKVNADTENQQKELNTIEEKLQSEIEHKQPELQQIKAAHLQSTDDLQAQLSSLKNEIAKSKHENKIKESMALECLVKMARRAQALQSKVQGMFNTLKKAEKDFFQYVSEDRNRIMVQSRTCEELMHKVRDIESDLKVDTPEAASSETSMPVEI